MLPSEIVYALPSPIYWVMVVLWGLSLGSFTTCVMYRLPRGISLWKQQDGSYRSFCPVCHNALHWRDLVPVLSWVLQKGRCRYCKTPISVYYPVVELIVLACVGLVGYLCNGSIYFFIISFIVPFLAAIGAVIRYRFVR